jgi:hypothetical protein
MDRLSKNLEEKVQKMTDSAADAVEVGRRGLGKLRDWLFKK